ncbi:MAG: hypothetical protein F4X17_10870 [Gemmatimonadetes bacterium]|nr:hypothetical protein [Gemmatimonadota bacterium]MYI64162.1 hypothetical protein [Gemmatimonadota bacterium]
MQTVELGEKCREIHGVLDGRLYYAHYQSKSDPHVQSRPVFYLHPLLTEFYDSYTWSIDLCRAMAQLEMSVVRIEPQGHGNTGGEIASSNLNELCRDYQVGLNYLLRECGHTDCSCLTIVGCRLGANMGLWLAEESPLVKTVWMIDPVNSIGKYLKTLNRKRKIVGMIRQGRAWQKTVDLGKEIETEPEIDMLGYRVKSQLLQDLEKRGGLADNTDEILATVVYVDTGRDRGGSNGDQRSVSCPPYWNRLVARTDPGQNAAISQIASEINASF